MLKNCRALVYGITFLVGLSGARAELPTAPLTYGTLKGGAVAEKWLSVAVLDIGQGNCILVTCPNGDQTIYDCGSSQGYAAKRAATESFFRNTLVTAQHLRAILVSHGDIDHINKLAEILTAANIISADSLYYGGERNNLIDNVIGLARPASVFGKTNMAFQLGPTPGLGCTSSRQGDGVSIYAANAVAGSNASSVVARLVFNNFSILFTGDMERSTEEKILEGVYRDSLLSTASVITHHGSSNRTNSPSFVAKVSPKIAVFSSGYRPGDYAHPRCLIKALFEAAPRGLSAASPHAFTCYRARHDAVTEAFNTEAAFNTHDSGAVLVFSDGDQFSVWTCASPLNLAGCVQVVAPRSTN